MKLKKALVLDLRRLDERTLYGTIPGSEPLIGVLSTTIPSWTWQYSCRLNLPNQHLSSASGRVETEAWTSFLDEVISGVAAEDRQILNFYTYWCFVL